MNNKQPGEVLAIVSLVIGIVAIVFCWLPYFQAIMIPGSIVAIVLGSMAKKQGYNGGLLTAGLVVAVIGIVLNVILFFPVTVCYCKAQQFVGEIDDALGSLSSLF